MKSVLVFLSYLISGLIITVVNLAFVNAAPFPVNDIQLIFLTTAWLVLYTENVKLLWLALLAAFLSQLFASGPFGIYFLSVFAAIFMETWLLLNVFTNHSWVVMLFTAAASMTIYNLIYVAGMYFIGHESFAALVGNAVWSTAVTAVTFAAIFAISSVFITRFNPRYIKMR